LRRSSAASATARSADRKSGLSLSPEQLFVIGAVSQYAGAVIAVNLFDEASAASIGWFRVIGAVLVLAPLTARGWRGWSRADYASAALFGSMTAGMNISFYIALDHLPLGNSVAIEFIGPISVAALRTRNRRNAMALGLAIAGVIVLSGTEVGDDAVGLVFIFLAAALWAGYIVFGSKVARQDRGLSGLSLGLLFGVLATAPIGLVDASSVVSDGSVLATALFVGVLSSAIPYSLDQIVLRRVSVRRFALLQALLPVVATLMGAIVLDQRPSAIALVGIALVVTAVIVQEKN